MREKMGEGVGMGVKGMKGKKPKKGKEQAIEETEKEGKKGEEGLEGSEGEAMGERRELGRAQQQTQWILHATMPLLATAA